MRPILSGELDGHRNNRVNKSYVEEKEKDILSIFQDGAYEVGCYNDEASLAVVYSVAEPEWIRDAYIVVLFVLYLYLAKRETTHRKERHTSIPLHRLLYTRSPSTNSTLTSKHIL